MGQFYNWSFGSGNDWGFISDSTYSNIIYTDPCCPNTRPVTGNITSYAGESVCVSGGITTARCSLIVQATIVTQCSAGSCADNVWAKRTAAGVVCRQGDSGGPVFSASGSNATGRGHISFVSVPPDNNCWYNELFRMQNAGFTVLTS